MLAPPWKGGPAPPSVRALCWPCSGKAQGLGKNHPEPSLLLINVLLAQMPLASFKRHRCYPIYNGAMLTTLQHSRKCPSFPVARPPHGASCCPSDSGQGGPALSSDLPMGLLQEVPRERKTTAPGKAHPTLLSASVELPGSPAVTCRPLHPAPCKACFHLFTPTAVLGCQSV